MPGASISKSLLIIAIAVIMTVMSGLYPVAAAWTPPVSVYDSRVLDDLRLELKGADTYRALVRVSSGEMRSVPFGDIEGAAVYKGRTTVYFKAGGAQVSGEYLEPDLIKHCSDNSDDISPAGISPEEAGRKIGLDRLNDLVKGGSQTIIVAVLDTGADITHPWLQKRAVSPYDAANSSIKIDDRVGHGTHVAGIIARNTPEQVRIMPVKVFTDEGDAPDSVIVKGIDYAVKHGADVINLSLGGYGTTSYLDKAIDYAVSQGIVVVASAGNDSRDASHYYPAAFPEAITVGATGSNGDLLYYSNTGDAVDICAPGENIISASPGGLTESRSGTSMASPLAACAAALLLLEDPSRTPSQIDVIIRGNSCDLGSPGKDKLFGWGEISFENYETDPDFYMIGASREEAGAEEKYNINVGYYAGPVINRTDILIDGSMAREVPSTIAGEKRLSLDIRNLKTGAHTIEIQPVRNDGTRLPSYKRSFNVPQYNVRIKVYDVNSKLVPVPPIEVLGFSSNDKDITRFEPESVVENGVWMANLDFEQLARRYDKIRCSLRLSPGSRWAGIPFYYRVTATPGDKVFEPSGCYVAGFTTRDPVFGCTVETRLLGGNMNGFDQVEAWGGNALETDISTADIPFVNTGESDGAPAYSGIFYYDLADLWLDVYSYSGGTRQKADENAGSWYYSGRLDDVGTIVDITSADQIKLDMETDVSSAEPPQYILLNIPTGDSVINSFMGQAGTFRARPGNYDLFLLTKRNLEDGRIALDGFYTSFSEEEEGSSLDYSFGKDIEDRFIYDSKRKKILHKWEDGYGNGYTVVVQGSKENDFCIPIMSLTDYKGRAIKITGADVTDAGDYIHGYPLDGVPDGTYRVSFINKADCMACPVKPSWTVITVKNEEVYSQGNTSPVAYSDYISEIRPGELFIYDLNEEFSDKEKDELEFYASAGWIVNGMFFYRDLIGENADITITAYDGAGGSASFKHAIRVTDKSAAEEGYTPNPDIDSIGAASWAAPYVKDAITAGIVPADLLDSYQSNITRQEFSALVVRLAETLTGEITPSPDIGFKDTRNPDVLKAATKRFLAGSNGYFNPREELSRQQFCVIVYQAVKVMRPDLMRPSINAPPFRDANGIATWAKEAVSFCTANGIMAGSGGILNPTGKLSREQAILMLYKAYEVCRQ